MDDDDDSCVMKYIEIVPLDNFEISPDSTDVKFDLSHVKVEPADEDTEQNNTFDDQTSNVINIDDMPVDDVKEIGSVTQVATAEETKSLDIMDDWKLKISPVDRIKRKDKTLLRQLDAVNIQSAISESSESESTFDIKTEVDDSYQFHHVDTTSHQTQFTDSARLNVYTEAYLDSKPEHQKSRSDHQCLKIRVISYIGKYKCTECGKCCASSGDLAVHMRSHSGEKPYECTVCNKRFTLSSTLVTHSRIHTGEKPYKCHMCDKAFSQSGDLSRHKRIHSGDKPYQCSLCHKAFRRSAHLDRHMKVHTGDKPYKCSLCGKAFSESGNLSSHMKVHTRDKPYICSLCGKAFSESGALKVHMRVHTGEKPYKCHMCDKAFSRSGVLSHHTRVHSGDKPYKCSLCDKAFRQSAHLDRHMRVHSGSGGSAGGLIELSPPNSGGSPPNKSEPFKGLKSAKRQAMPKLRSP